MAKFTNCLQIVNAMPEQDQEALLARLDELQAQGMSPKEAQLQAAIDVLAQVEQAADPESGADATDIRWSPRRGPAPRKTVTAYKLFRVDAKKPGQLFPLFVNANDPVEIGKWLDAEEGPMQGGKVKSKLGPLAYRPGWHAGDLPIATHIGGKSNAALKKPDVRPDNQVWAEVEMAADKDWQTEANKRGTNADGKFVAVRAHITDQIPKNGFYRYKTNPNMTGNWLIGGSMKVNRILSDAEVEAINAAAGTADLPRETPFDAKKYGFEIRKSAPRITDTTAFKRWFGDSKVVDENGEPLVVYHGTGADFTAFSKQDTGIYGKGFYFTTDSAAASWYAESAAKPSANVMPVYLSIQNLATAEDYDRIAGNKNSAKAKTDALIRAGFDGLAIDFGNGRTDYVAFQPTQIKSATGNNGAFDPTNPDIRKSAGRVTETPQFKRWSGGAPVIRLGDEHEFRSGQPVVVEALHGTTNADLTEFKRERANIESDMGAGFYASNTPEDVARNYANVDGPDLTQRVELLAERLEEDFDGDMDAAREEARKRLSQGAPNTMKLYMRFKNPVVIGDNETYLDYSESFDEETEEYGEPEGKLVEFVEALRDIAPNFNASDSDIESAVGKIFDEAQGDGLKVTDALSIIKRELMDAFDDNGNSASSEIFRQALSKIGFDGVIDTTVYDKFGPKMRRNGQTYDRSGGMKGMTPDTVHFIAFEPEQIKSATGNSGEFGENREILKSAERIARTPEFKKWFGDSVVVNADGTPKVVYRGEHGADGGIDFQSRLASLSFGTIEVANAYAVEPNDSADSAEAPRLYPVYLRIENPLMNDPSDPFIELGYVADKLGMDVAESAARKFAPEIEGTGNWEENFADEYDSVDQLLDERPEAVRELYTLAWRFFDMPEFVNAAKKAGYDGAIHAEYGTHSENEEGAEYKVFDQAQVKSIFNKAPTSSPDITKSVDRPQFYSQLQRAIEGVPARLDNMGAAAWKQWLTANASKLGIKSEEIEWSGIKDYLDLQGKKKLSKDELARYLDESGVRVSEVQLGTLADSDKANTENWRAYRMVDDWWEVINPAVDEKPFIEISPDNASNEQEAIAFAASSINENRQRAAADATKYNRYTLPGGENYRELLITLPSNVEEAKAKHRAFLQSMKDKYGDDGTLSYAKKMTAEERAEAKRLSAYNEQSEYSSSHWDVPNVLAHIRINDRADADGNKVLFVEEIQSDWGQEGKKKGFALSPAEKAAKSLEITRLQMEINAIRDAGMQVPRPGTAAQDVDPNFLRTQELIRQRDALQTRTADNSIPVAPFVTKTEGWLNLALKRIAMLAVEEGYDKVAFVNGEQSADRYDLSKRIDRIKYAKNSDGTYDLAIRPQGEQRDMVSFNDRSLSGLTESDVEEMVGKEIAQKIVAGEGPQGGDNFRTLEGVDLKVGGEGMKAFYDQIVPQALNKLLPKLGGEKLGTVAFGKAAKYRAIQSDADGGGEVVTADGETISFHDTAEEARAEARRLNGGALGTTGMEQSGFDVTDKMRETVGAGVPLFSRDRTETAEFKKWFGDSKVVDAEGKPLVMYTGTSKDKDFTKFNIPKNGAWFTTSPEEASMYAKENDSRDLKYQDGKYVEVNTASRVMPVYLRIENPATLSDEDMQSMRMASNYKKVQGQIFDRLRAQGHDGVDLGGGVWVVIRDAKQIKSAIGNSGQFDPANPDIRKSPARPYLEDLAKLKVSTNYQLGDLLKSSKKLNWWNRTVGTQYNLAQKNTEFKRVFDAVQTFINDVSAYATQAADLAPNILPKLDGIKDVLKKPLSAEDVKALRDPVFGGTLKYMRDENGQIVETDDVQAAGVVFTDEELRDMFGLNDRQIGLYREFRQATDRSLTDLALSDMIRYIGEDGVDIREAVMASSNVDVGAGIIESHLEQLADENPARADSLNATIEAIRQKGEQANRLMDRGYAPLSRFGQYTVYAVGKNGEQLYFGMFETQRDANKMAREMADQYPDAEITTGTMSQESYKLFSGVTPETLALFGESLGLEESGIDPKSEVFQQYLKLAKTNRSAMKRLIERKGIDGFSEDAGRVLAGFVYSNARQVSTNLHAGEISRSASEIKDGDVKDHAIRLMEYIQNPTEEAQKLKALLFTTFLGGNISSAIVNFTQTATTTFPYLSQFDGTGSVMKRLGDAVKLAARGIRNDDELKQALKRAEDEGVVSPQEVFHLMAQAQGKAQLQTGDGTRVGDALAKTNNFMTKATLAWGRLFSAAEQANRRIAFIAAYKLARDKGMDNPFEFAEKAVLETQFSTNKGIRPAWARGAVGGVLFTFKGFTISYLELLGRMLGNGPEGKKAFALALGTLFLFAGAGGMPFVDDLDDVVDGFAQRVLGKSFDSKQAKKEFFASIFGQTGAEFVMGGLTSLPGAPIDLSGRLGLGNIIPGTGIAPKKSSYQRDAMEIFGPAGSLFSNYAMAVGMLAQGEVGSAAAQAAPLGIQNLIKGMDMAQMGFYRDTKGRKVIDTNGWEAAFKALGFQPASVKRIQDATSTQQGLIAQNKLRETEIADKMARARVERKPELAQEAREELAEWNRKNPESPIRIDQAQINRRVQQAMMDKAKRIEKTAPKEIRQSVARELERAN